MSSIVVGLGEVGTPLFEILRVAYPDIYGYDLKRVDVELPKSVEVLNICFPWSLEFSSSVTQYQIMFGPTLTIIHSTVPVGTTEGFVNAVHSPVLGRHSKIKDDMFKYKKWVGGSLREEAASFLGRAGFKCRLAETSRETELLKLMCLAKYGVSLAFANYQKLVCDKENIPYSVVIDWDEDYNRNVGDLKRPMIQPDGTIGGHCVVPGTKLLDNEYPNRLLREVLTYER